MKLFLIHCGFYDEEISAGIYEFHVNLPVIANDLDDAKKRVRLEPAFIQKKMHIDGIQELKMVSGYRIELMSEAGAQLTQIDNHLYRDL